MRKKILFLTAFLPHPGAAAEKNTMLMLEDLSRIYDIDLIYFKYEYDKEYVSPNTHIRVVGVFKNSLINKITNVVCYPIVHPLFSVRFNWSILRYIKKLSKKEQYDALVCEHSQMFLYAKYLDAYLPKFIFCHDVIIQRVQRTSNSLISSFCKWSERTCLKIKNATFYSVSQKDCDILKEYYSLNASPCLAYVDKQVVNAVPTEIRNEYVFMGKWSRADNLDGVIYFFDKVAPLIKKEITISIIGKNFPLNKINNNNPHVKINVLGFVDDPYPLIANCKAMLSPLFSGAGTKQKVFESLACGTPVIGTEIAFEGINPLFSKYMLLCKKPEDYVKAIEECSFSLEERIDLKMRFIEAYHSKTMPEYISEILH